MTRKVSKKVTPRPKQQVFRRTFILQWREFRNLTQEQLAERMTEYFHQHGISKGYTYASVGRLETGKIGYSQIALEAAADALNTDVASLLMRDPSDPTGIWSVWDQAKVGDKLKIVEIAKTIVGKAGTG